jgi:glycerate 2-kinase
LFGVGEKTTPDPFFRVIAAGKAAHAMARAAARVLDDRIRAGLVISPTDAAPPPPFESHIGGHPLPTADSERAGRRALDVARALAPDEALLVLLSGGASALMAVPAAGVTLDDKRRTTDVLLRAGADIHALNTVRKHLSAIKGGWLAAQTPGACHTLAISDVVGDDLSVIASGPTVADETTFAEALTIVRSFGGVGAYPPSGVGRLEAGARGEVADTPKPADPRLARAAARVIGGRRDAMTGAATQAQQRGYHVVRIDEAVVGEARTAAAAALRAVHDRAANVPRPACVISSGETTVHVVGHGKGGRNQEFALAIAAANWRGTRNAEPFAAASAGTDGIDGPTDAAGAMVDSTTVERARRAGLSPPARYLDDNDAYAFFRALGDLIHTGPTDTNVGDLQVFLLQ